MKFIRSRAFVCYSEWSCALPICAFHAILFKSEVNERLRIVSFFKLICVTRYIRKPQTNSNSLLFCLHLNVRKQTQRFSTEIFPHSFYSFFGIITRILKRKRWCTICCECSVEETTVYSAQRKLTLSCVTAAFIWNILPSACIRIFRVARVCFLFSYAVKKML